MAGVIMFDPRKQPVMNAARRHRDGLTGMGSHTKRHFVDVQQKMINYVQQQEQMGYDEMYPHQQFDPGFLDAKKAPKSQVKPSTPIAPRKQPALPGFSTPQVNRRHRVASPRPPRR